MAAIVDLAEAEDDVGYVVEVEWVGFSKEENIWEDLAKIRDAAPQFVKTELCKMGLQRDVRATLKQEYGIVL